MNTQELASHVWHSTLMHKQAVIGPAWEVGKGVARSGLNTVMNAPKSFGQGVVDQYYGGLKDLNSGNIRPIAAGKTLLTGNVTPYNGKPATPGIVSEYLYNKGRGFPGAFAAAGYGAASTAAENIFGKQNNPIPSVQQRSHGVLETNPLGVVTGVNRGAAVDAAGSAIGGQLSEWKDKITNWVTANPDKFKMLLALLGGGAALGGGAMLMGGGDEEEDQYAQQDMYPDQYETYA